MKKKSNKRFQVNCQFTDVTKGEETKNLLLRCQCIISSEIFDKTGMNIRVSTCDALHYVLREFAERRNK